MVGELPGVLIFATSPRHGGNTDTAAAILAETLQKQGIASFIAPLRDYKLMPCRGCNYCGIPGNACILAQRDDCDSLFAQICAARVIFWLAPIFFYHLPAQFNINLAESLLITGLDGPGDLNNSEIHRERIAKWGAAALEK